MGKICQLNEREYTDKQASTRTDRFTDKPTQHTVTDTDTDTDTVTVTHTQKYIHIVTALSHTHWHCPFSSVTVTSTIMYVCVFVCFE